MAEKKADNRDIFEKALDDLPVNFAQVALGALGARAAGKLWRTIRKPTAAEAAASSRKMAQRNEAKRRDNLWTAGGAAFGGVSAEKDIEKRRRK